MVCGAVGSMASPYTVSLRPSFMALQDSAPSRDLYTPWLVPTYTVVVWVGSILRDDGYTSGSVVSDHVTAPSAVLNSPPPEVVAYRTCGDWGSSARSVTSVLV